MPLPPSTPSVPRFKPPKVRTQHASRPGHVPSPDVDEPKVQFSSTPRFSLPSAKRTQTPDNHARRFATSAAVTSELRPDHVHESEDALGAAALPSHDEEGEDAEGADADANREGDLGNAHHQRFLKRRRLDIESSPSEAAQRVDDEITTATPTSHEQPLDIDLQEPSDPLGDTSTSSTASQASVEPSSPIPQLHPIDQIPTFRPAPRFKPPQPSKPPEARYELPDIFSPQRRGVRYVPGGLAAELRDWLIQVKGESEYDVAAAAKGQSGHESRLAISSVSCAPGMNVVVASRKEGLGRSEGEVRMILAGAGRIDGLTRPTVVEVDKEVCVFQPTWDVELGELGRFVVACDWKIA